MLLSKTIGMKLCQLLNISEMPEHVPLWVFDLLCDEVECVPARVGIQC